MRAFLAAQPRCTVRSCATAQPHLAEGDRTIIARRSMRSTVVAGICPSFVIFPARQARTEWDNRKPQARCRSGRRRGRLQHPHGEGRGGHTARAEGLSAAVDRPENRRLSRTHRKADRRRCPRRILQRRERRQMRRGDPDRAGGKPTQRPAGPHRHPFRRRYRRWRRHLRRRREHRLSSGGNRRAGRHLRLGAGLRRGQEQARHRLRAAGRPPA